MEHLIYIEMLAVAYMLWMAVTMCVKNTRSHIVFKALPLMMGMGMLVDVFYRSGWVVNLS